MILSKKVRILPTSEQEQKLWQAVGTARFIYNWTLSKQEESYENGGRFISDGVLRKDLTVLKQGELSWLRDVSNNVAKQAVKDACNSYIRYFKNQSKKPKFKTRRKSKKSFYHDTDKLKIGTDFVQLERIGIIKTAEQLPTNINSECQKYSNPRISYDNKYWYISVGIEQKEIQEELTGISLGVDFSLKDLVVCSDGKIFENINKTRVVKNIEKKINRLQKQISKKYSNNKIGKEYVKTKNIIKLEKKIQLIYRRLKNIRQNHIHQVTSSIVKTKPYRVVIANLNTNDMTKNIYLSQLVVKQCFHEIKRQLGYKCKFRGIELVIARKAFKASQICSNCSSIKKDFKLKDRIYKCSCGLSIDTDLNASLNLAYYNLA